MNEQLAQVLIFLSKSAANSTIILAICDLIRLPSMLACWIVGIVVIQKLYARRYATLSSVEYGELVISPILLGA